MLNLRKRADTILGEMVLSSPSIFVHAITRSEQACLADILYTGLTKLVIDVRRQVAEGVINAFLQGEEPEDA